MSLRRGIVALAMTLGLWQVGSGLYIPAKAVLAQWLIHRAWTETQAGGVAVKPWEWADTSPVARLVVPEHDKDLIVLAGAFGEALAFGPGHVAQSATPGSEGHTVIGGHRDTHFRFLEDISRGEHIELESADGRRHRYQVESTRVVDSTQSEMTLTTGGSLLSLITCYPFDAVVPGGPLRYVVTARRI